MGNKYHLQYKAKGNASLWVECKAESWNSSPEDNFGMVGLDCQDLNLQYSKPLRTLSPKIFLFVCLFFYLFACLFVFFFLQKKEQREWYLPSDKIYTTLNKYVWSIYMYKMIPQTVTIQASLTPLKMMNEIQKGDVSLLFLIFTMS